MHNAPPKNKKKNKTGYTIYIRERPLETLRKVVVPHIHSTMLYKLRLEKVADQTPRLVTSTSTLSKKIYKIKKIKTTELCVPNLTLGQVIKLKLFN
jgi:hypothetical protein